MVGCAVTPGPAGDSLAQFLLASASPGKHSSCNLGLPLFVQKSLPLLSRLGDPAQATPSRNDQASGPGPLTSAALPGQVLSIRRARERPPTQTWHQYPTP